MFYSKIKSIKLIHILFYILVTVFLLMMIYNYNIKTMFKSIFNNYDSFVLPQTTKFNNDGTQLYGSLFLDNLNEVIKNMTDPPIMYDNKSIVLNKYNDVLL
jgi:hypothetical protein